MKLPSPNALKRKIIIKVGGEVMRVGGGIGVEVEWRGGWRDGGEVEWRGWEGVEWEAVKVVGVGGRM